MKPTLTLLTTLLLSPLAALHAVDLSGAIQPVGLRTEYLTNPSGIDVVPPRLSWVPESSNPTARSLRQTAYQVLVSSSTELLARNSGDVWDSGKVISDETVGIVYAGKALRSRDDCHWKVRVWDQDGRVSGWSEANRWTMGLLNREDWHAKWITLPSSEPQTTAHFGYQSARAKSPKETKWVQIDLGGSRPCDGIRLWPAWPTGRNAVPGSGFPVRFKIEIADQEDFSDARPVVDRTAKDVPNPGQEPLLLRFSPVTGRFVRLTALVLSGHGAAIWDDTLSRWKPGPLTRSPMLALAEMEILSGDTNLALGKPVRAMDAWDDDPEASAIRNIETHSAERHGGWSRKFLTDGRTDADLGSRFHLIPVALLRREFEVSKKVKRAVLRASAQGCYEFRLNGARVGDEQLAPGWTIYAKRVLYQTHDVTALVKPGANALGAMLADGWFRMRGWDYFGSNKRFTGYFNADDRWLIGQLEIEYADGSRQILGTDSSWQGSDDGPIRGASMYDGVHYDARKEIPGWDRAGLVNRSAWRPTVERGAKGGPVLSAQMMPPIRFLQQLPPKSRSELRPGVFIFDFGEQLAGVCRVRVDGPAGTTVRLRFAQALNRDGTLYVANLMGSHDNEDVIVLDGRGPKTFAPPFTYHGFQYVEVSGLHSADALQEITALQMGSDLVRATTFASSDPRLNRLGEIIERSYRSCILSLTVDCAARDERLPWMGDCYVDEAQPLATLFDFAAFGANQQRVITDSLNSDGVAPPALTRTFAEGATASAGYSDSPVIPPVALWRNYADRRTLALSYEGARKFAGFVARNLEAGIPGKDYAPGYGDWLSSKVTIPPGATAWEPKGGGEAAGLRFGAPGSFFASAWAAQMIDGVAEMATALNKPDDARQFAAVRDQIRTALRKNHVKPDGTITGHEQSSYALMLGMKHLDGDLGAKADVRLLDAIRAYHEHLSTGSITTHLLLKHLAATGHQDLAYRMVMQPTVPSYGAIVDMGASAIPERFDSRHPTLGLNPNLMNSLNHIGLNSVFEWIFSCIGGIVPDPAAPGYKHFFIAPKLGGGLTSMRLGYDSIRGRIESSYEIEGGRLQLNVTVPPNTAASLTLPAGSLAGITESGRTLDQAQGVHVEDASRAIVRLDSGHYRFAIPPEPH